MKKILEAYAILIALGATPNLDKQRQSAEKTVPLSPKTMGMGHAQYRKNIQIILLPL